MFGSVGRRLTPEVRGERWNLFRIFRGGSEVVDWFHIWLKSLEWKC